MQDKTWNNSPTNYLDFTNLPNDYDSFLFDIRAIASANNKDFMESQFIIASNDLIIDGNNYDWTSQKLQCASNVQFVK